MKHQDALYGNKTSTDITIISLYGLKEMRNDWMVQGDAAYGFSNNRSKAIRKGKNPAIAYAKSKSDYFGASAQIVKRLHINGFVIDQTLGINYSDFNDKAYREYGTNITPWTIAKRNSYNVEALIGGKISVPYQTAEWRYVPNISSYAHIT